MKHSHKESNRDSNRLIGIAARAVKHSHKDSNRDANLNCSEGCEVI